jgi:hypothetical protein
MPKKEKHDYLFNKKPGNSRVFALRFADQFLLMFL